MMSTFAADLLAGNRRGSFSNLFLKGAAIMNHKSAWAAWSIAAFAVFQFSACDNAVDFPMDELPTFDENSPARYFGRLEVEEGFPQQLDDGTLRYQFKRDVPAERIPASVSPGAESVPAIGRGPACWKGAPYNVLVQKGPADKPNNLLIETEGGGACFVDAPTPGDCLSPRDEAARAWPTGDDTTFTSDDATVNPFTSNWDRVYLPYCDSSLYTSDTNALPAGGDAADAYRYFRGNQNFAAGLQVAKSLNPNPDKVVLSGYSGGGYGVVINIPMVRQVFPDADIYVYSDGGTLVGDRNGEPGFLESAVEDYNASYYLPDDCDDCLADGTLFGAVVEFIERNDPDTELRVALATSLKNLTIATLFLQYSSNIEDYVDVFVNALLDVEDADPSDNFAAYIIDGNRSTMSAIASQQGVSSKFDVVIDGVRFGDWIEDFLDSDSAWETVSEVPLER